MAKTTERSIIYLHIGHKSWIKKEMRTGKWRSESALIRHLLTLGIKAHVQ